MTTPQDLVALPRETVQRLFDLAVGSLDFGSGWWESDDVEHGRAVAVALGVDPDKATPQGFRRNYAHEFVPRHWDDLCDWCHHGRQLVAHGAPS